MGAGAVKGQVDTKEGSSSTSNDTADLNRNIGAQGDLLNSTSAMSCEACKANFSIFKKKRPCVGCGLYHCSNCLRKDSKSRKRCSPCTRLLSGNFTRHDLGNSKIRHLRAFLIHNKVPVNNCTEKNDLIELVLKFSQNSQYLREEEEIKRHTEELQARSRERDVISRQDNPGATEIHEEDNPITPSHDSTQSSNTESTPSSTNNIVHPVPPRENGTSAEEAASSVPSQDETEEDRMARLLQRQRDEMRESEQRRTQNPSDDTPPDPRPAINRMTLDAVNNEENIEVLSVRQLKEVLATNFVDYKGCVEKYELVERVKRLWSDHQTNTTKHQKLDHRDHSDSVEKDVCKICMDAMSDCVLLECGHIVTCTACGKRLAECPICRQYVSRVVRIFKA